MRRVGSTDKRSRRKDILNIDRVRAPLHPPVRQAAVGLRAGTELSEQPRTKPRASKPEAQDGVAAALPVDVTPYPARCQSQDLNLHGRIKPARALNAWVASVRGTEPPPPCVFVGAGFARRSSSHREAL